MAAEELREQVDTAIASAIGGDTDLDDIEDVLDDAQERLDRVRAYEGGA